MLEGVAAFFRQDLPRAKASLQAALAKWERLQVSDASLAMLAGMGMSAQEVGIAAVRISLECITLRFATACCAVLATLSLCKIGAVSYITCPFHQ